jgi:hypothetical protein
MGAEVDEDKGSGKMIPLAVPGATGRASHPNVDIANLPSSAVDKMQQSLALLPATVCRCEL